MDVGPWVEFDPRSTSLHVVWRMRVLFPFSVRAANIPTVTILSTILVVGALTSVHEGATVHT